ncbi:MAG: hypothetical protein AAF360_18845, partial [Pseudomonadota bacterium]
DVFVASNGVTVADFGNGDDQIDLTGLGVQSLEELQIVVNGERASIFDAASGARFGVVGDDGAPALSAESFIFAPLEALSLIGDAGVNTLAGRAGDDLIISDEGADLVTGNGGADTFVIAPRGRDTVTDFTLGEDLLDVSALGVMGFEELKISDRVGLVEVAGGVGGVRLLNGETGLSAADLSADNFIFTELLLS